MEPTKKTARIAGFFYLLLIVTGVFSILYVPSQLVDWNDAARTIANIKASEWLFWAGIVSNLICFLCFIGLPLALYVLLQGVDRFLAVAMVLFAVVSVPVSFANVVHHLDVLTAISGGYAMTMETLGTRVMLSLESFNNGNLVAHIFWGLWLFPFGLLVYRSGFLPKILGVMLMLGCFGYLIDFLGYLFEPDYGDTLLSAIVGIPSMIGEFGICLWLLIKGIAVPRSEPVA